MQGLQTTATIEHPQLGKPVAVYEYQRASGDTAFVVCRFDPKDFRPAQHRGERWVWNLEGAPVLPYRLPQIEEALAASETIWIVDGEKDADAIVDNGGYATCCARSQGWTLELAEQLTGARQIRIVADKDAGVGLKQARDVRDTLVRAGAIASCDIEIDTAAAGKDAHDHFAAGFSLSDFIYLDDLEPEEQSLNGSAPQPVIFETLRAFLQRDVPKSESLVGVTRDGTNLLPRYGWVMPWGKEGSGKTSILVDLLFHACAGIDWLQYPIGRALKIVAVVNEGVPGGLQDKLQQKTERWEHDDAVLDNLAIYASPWGEFTFANERMVEHAQDFCRDFGADYIALDPLHTLGTNGVGSPVETEAFKHVLRAFGLWEWIGIITSHHSNKSGMLSGDWGRHPDTVILLEKDGKNPSTKFTLHKARPADPTELGVPCLLDWETDSLGYTRRELKTTPLFDEPAALETALHALAAAGEPMGKEALRKVIPQTATHVRDAIERWIQDGKIVDQTPDKRAYRLVLPSYVAGEPTQPDATLRGDEQTSMVEPNNTDPTPPTQPDATMESPEDPSCSLRRPPFREEDVTDATERADFDFPF